MNGVTEILDGFNSQMLIDFKTRADSIYTTSSETDWGFIPFDVPIDVVNISDGEDLAAAVASLPNGGTVNMGAGTYNCSDVRPFPNTVIQGAGSTETFLIFNGSGDDCLIYVHGGSVVHGKANFILRGFSADCTTPGEANGIQFAFGVDNVLMEDLVVFNSIKTNINWTGSDWDNCNTRLTIRDVETYGATIHGITVSNCYGSIVENCNAHDNDGYNIDYSKAVFCEMVNSTMYNSGTGSSKLPSSTYLYFHGIDIYDNPSSAMQFDMGSYVNTALPSSGRKFVHIKDFTVDNSTAGLTTFGDFVCNVNEEFVIENVVSTNNDWEGTPQNEIRLKGVNNLYEYVGMENMAVASECTFTNVNYRPSTTPQEDGVGWTSYPPIESIMP